MHRSSESLQSRDCGTETSVFIGLSLPSALQQPTILPVCDKVMSNQKTICHFSVTAKSQYAVGRIGA